MVISRRSRFSTRLWIVGLLAASIFSVQPASAFLGRAFGGAMKGAFLGSLLDGHEGAQTGAAIGAGVGILTSVAEDAKRRDSEKAARARAEQQKAEMELRKAQEEQTRFEAASAYYNEGLPSNVAAIGTLQPFEDVELITQVQRALVKLDYDPGRIDGELNDRTMTAIQTYQAKHSLLETGQPSPELLKHMARNGG